MNLTNNRNENEFKQHHPGLGLPQLIFFFFLAQPPNSLSQGGGKVIVNETFDEDSLKL